MCKPYSADEAAKVLRMTHDAGGKAIINIMCGHPGETEKEFVKTLDFLSENAESIGMVASVGFTGVHIHSPLLDQCEAYGVVLDEHGGWTSDGGVIDRELRNERVHRVTEHLRATGIPCFEAFWESDRAQQKEETVPELSTAGDRTLHISALQISGPDGQSSPSLDAEHPIYIRVGYVATEGVDRAVFDLRVTDLQGHTVLSTPAATETVREQRLTGQGWVQMVLAAHDLAPGWYIFSARVHPLHSEGIYDQFILRTPVEVMGVARRAADVMTPYTWTHHPGGLASASTSPVVMVRIRDAYGVESHGLLVGDPLEIIVGLAPRPETIGNMHYRILTHEGECAHESSVHELDLNEPTTSRWRHERLDVAAGPYNLEMVLTIGDDTYLSHHHIEAREAGSGEDPGEAYLAPWEEWHVLPDPPEIEEERPQLVVVEVVRKDGLDGPLTPGSVLVAKMSIAGLGKGLAGLHCRTWITGEDGVVAGTATTGQVATPSGAIRLDQHLQLNLLEGTYHMHCAVWNLKEDQAREPVWSFPLVIGTLGRQAGGGSIYSPHELTADEA